MARMLPPTVPEGTPSPAERLVFRHIRDELSNEWIVLHSLGMTIHDTKPWAEIDFVLIGPPGVFCLEVKGGLVSRKDGVWYTTPRGGPNEGRAERLKESPFQQVASASAELFRFLEQAVPGIGKAIIGYAVATPDVEWTIKGPDIDVALVYDQADTLRSFADFANRVAKRWTERIGTGWNRKLEPLGKNDKQQILDAIRGDFRLVPSMRATADSAERELVRLTEEQVALFGRLSANDRVIAHGGAGTGKTLIAVEEAKRLTASGERVLFTCYSRNLAEQVARSLAGLAHVTVRTLHGLMNDIVQQAGRKGDLPDVSEEDLFTLFLPELALDVLLHDERPGQFDCVIVDEAQDLLRSEYLDVLEALVGGDFGRGRWRIFIDPNQNIFGGIAPAGLERLQNARAVDWPLSVNCRNTAPIATQVALLSGTPLAEVLSHEGPAAELEWYTSTDAEREAVRQRLRQLRRDGFAPQRLVVLSRYRRERSVAQEDLGIPLTDISRGSVKPEDDTVAFSTISSFKGLESDVVLLVDVDDLTSNEGMASVYVGASRARVALFVFIAKKERDRFEVLAADLGRTLAEKSG